MKDDRERKATGRKGEDIACMFLMDNGHTILERNWRSGHLEIDIISYDNDGIHFVEVKTRRSPMQARPQECVTVTKQKRIASAAAKFLSQGCRTGKYSSIKGRIADAECRFDVIAVIFYTDGTKIEYYPEAFFPTFV